MQRAIRGFLILVSILNGMYVAALAAAGLLMLWTGFELIFMYNHAALGYFVVGALSAIGAVTLLRSSPQPNA